MFKGYVSHYQKVYHHIITILLSPCYHHIITINHHYKWPCSNHRRLNPMKIPISHSLRKSVQRPIQKSGSSIWRPSLGHAPTKGRMGRETWEWWNMAVENPYERVFFLSRKITYKWFIFQQAMFDLPKGIRKWHMVWIWFEYGYVLECGMNMNMIK